MDFTEKMVLGTAQFCMDYGIANITGQPEQKEIDQALQYYEKGIKIDSNFAEIYNNMGILFFKNRFSGNAKKIEDFY